MVTNGYKWLQTDTNGYKRLQMNTNGYKPLQTDTNWDTNGYKLGYKRIQTDTNEYKWTQNCRPNRPKDMKGRQKGTTKGVQMLQTQ